MLPHSAAAKSLPATAPSPEPGFWSGLYCEAPGTTRGELEREHRTARYALLVAAVLTGCYVAGSLGAARVLAPVIVTNGLALAVYLGGLRVSARGRCDLGRHWLLVGALFQFTALILLTGEVLRVHLYCLVAAALAGVVFTSQERRWRWVYIGLPFLLLVWGEVAPPSPMVDFSRVPAMGIEVMRLANLLLPVASVLLLLEVFAREVRRSESQLTGERERSDRLLHAVLPARIAEQLRNGERAIADHHPEVTVLFADLAGFTPWASQRPPEEVIALLEQVFSRFDGRVSALGAEKIKTIGDAYMAVCGAPNARFDHATVMAQLALDMLEEVRALRVETGIPLDVRVGLHTGPAIAGVIGSMRFAYDIWGDTVNTASRMESHGEPGRIQVSDEARVRLAHAFLLEPRGMIEVKGKGALPSFWLLGPRAVAA